VVATCAAAAFAAAFAVFFAEGVADTSVAATGVAGWCTEDTIIAAADGACIGLAAVPAVVWGAVIGAGIVATASVTVIGATRVAGRRGISALA